MMFYENFDGMKNCIKVRFSENQNTSLHIYIYIVLYHKYKILKYTQIYKDVKKLGI